MSELERGIVTVFNQDSKDGVLEVVDKHGRRTGKLFFFRHQNGQFIEFEGGSPRFLGAVFNMQTVPFPRVGEELIFQRKYDHVQIWSYAVDYDRSRIEATRPYYRLLQRHSGVAGFTELWKGGYGSESVPDLFQIRVVDGITYDPLTHNDYNGHGRTTFFQVRVIDGPDGEKVFARGNTLGRWEDCPDPRVPILPASAKAS